MLVDANPQSAAAANVTGAIRKAANVTGANFQYLLATAQVESGLDPKASAKTSSAGGLFQFIEQTWLGTLKEAGTQLGYGRYANAIMRTRTGRYVVADPSMQREILDLRKNATANALMAGVFTRSNANKLRFALGREATGGELYMAHFLGAAGATRLIEATESNPQASAAAYFSQGARANRSIFYDRQGRARSVTEVAELLSRRYDVAAANHPTAPLTAQAAPPPAAIPAAPAEVSAVARVGKITRAALDPIGGNNRRIGGGNGRVGVVNDPAALARAYEALAREAKNTVAPPDTTAAFRALARGGSREPIAPVVVKVWSVHAPQNAAAETFTQRFSAIDPARAGDGRFDLFQDFTPNARALFSGS